MLMELEIYEEASDPISDEAGELVSDAIDSVQKGDGVEAEKLLKQALTIEPDHPTLLFNLAKAYEVQKRREDAAALIRDIHARFPDYLFGIVGLAELSREEGDLDQAAELLKPLASRRRLHISEFVALAKAQIDLLLERDDLEGARRWHAMWKQIAPDHPGVAYYGRLMETQHGLFDSFQQLFKRRRSRTSRPSGG
jgi:tetratricopeptide (TPR) repeat protein